MGGKSMRNILIINDNDDILKSMILMLQKLGFIVRGAKDGVTGLRLAAASKPDIILCDEMMPFISGYSVLTALRVNPETATIPFLMVTMSPGLMNHNLLEALRVDGYLPQPCTMPDLVEALRPLALSVWH